MKFKAVRRFFYKGEEYEEGKVYDLPEKDVKAIGKGLAKPLKEKEEKAPKDKMVKGAKTK